MHSVFSNARTGNKKDIDFLGISDILVYHSGRSFLNIAFSTEMPENNTNC